MVKCIVLYRYKISLKKIQLSEFLYEDRSYDNNQNKGLLLKILVFKKL